MVREKEFVCRTCGVHFRLRARYAFYCRACGKKHISEEVMRKRAAKYPHVALGVGSGGNQWGRKNHCYKDGSSDYRRNFERAHPRQLYCEICNGIKNLVVHHVDENRKNNRLENLIISRYEKKGHTGCGNVNLLERDMMPAFAEAWEEILKTREERMALWAEQLCNENALISLRAKQMIHLTEKGKPNKEELLDVLRMTLDHVVVQPDGTLLIILLDGTELTVEFAAR